MRVALAQINVTVGDLDGNVRHILETIEAAEPRGASGITLFPELALTGYPPEDLRLQGALHRRPAHGARDGRRRVLAAGAHRLRGPRSETTSTTRSRCAATTGCCRRTTSAGFPTTASSTSSATSRRAPPPASSSSAGRCSPTRSARTSGSPSSPKRPPGRAHRSSSTSRRRRFTPARRASARRCSCARARDNNVWLAYCNLVGGQDELVFDGRSLVISPSGEVVARGVPFEEDLVIADFTPGAQARRIGRPRA